MRLLFRVIFGIVAVMAAIWLSVAVCGGLYEFTHNPQHRSAGQIVREDWQRALDWVNATAINQVNPPGPTPTTVVTNVAVASPPVDATPVPPPAPAWTPPAITPVLPDGTLTTPTQVYTDVRIIKVQADSITISHTGGMAVVPMWQLSSTLRDQLNYDPKAALSAAQNPSNPPINAEATSAQPMFVPATGPTPMAAIAETTDYQAALASAKATHKLVLLFFTGSDYCPTCKQLEAEVLSTGQFRAFAASNYVMVTLDFPQNNTQPESLRAQNDALHEKYQIQGVPTLIVIDPNERELGRMLGFPSDGTPNPVIAALEKYNRAD